MKSFKKLVISLLAGALATGIANGASAPMSGKIYYHLTFPVTVDGQTENIVLNENYMDLIMSNFVAGAMYAHLLHQHFPALKFDEQYIVGSLLAQLMQENLQTSGYQSSSEWINPDIQIRNELLASGQGGPYQINDYSKRLEDNIGLINFAVLQKSLGYTIEAQDSYEQTKKTGPATLDNKFFGPLAAAYFQYNDMLRLEAINADAWGPSALYFSKCLTHFNNQPNNFLDMILNAAYNAGPWADITKTYIELCANTDNPAYADKIKHINDYALTDVEYQHAVGTKEAKGSTFILYPRQIRFYLDELYNNPTSLQASNHYPFSMTQLRIIFAKSLSTLAYINSENQYVFINPAEADKAFNAALSSLNITDNQFLDIGNVDEKNKIIQLLEMSIHNLATSSKIDFSQVTEKDLG